jgi:hypothetical protein
VSRAKGDKRSSAGREKEERKEWKDFPASGGAVETLANSLRAIFLTKTLYLYR